MSSPVFSFLETDDLDLQEIEGVFAQAKKIKEHFLNTHIFPVQFSKPYLLALLFFEASTRTRLSFEMAAKRLGAHVTFFDGASKEGTSLIKGETYEDTFWTLHAMRPEMMIIRCGDQLDLQKLRMQVQVPLINAGYGVNSHPTQALLDVFTMQESFAQLEGKNVLFIGDVSHSRVAQSHFRLLPRLKTNIGVVGPQEFTKGLPSSIQTFADLNTALPWADVIIGLRVQFERHNEGQVFSRESYIEKYQLSAKQQKLFKPGAVVFHPGPVNWGLEFDPSLRQLTHFKMWDQKQNGVFVRAALLHLVAQKNGLIHG